MDGQCHKSCLLVVLIRLKIHHDLVKTLRKLQWREWWGIYSWGWCSISWKITWSSQWFTLFDWKNEDWKSWKTCSQLPQQKRMLYTEEI